MFVGLNLFGLWFDLSLSLVVACCLCVWVFSFYVFHLICCVLLVFVLWFLLLLCLYFCYASVGNFVCCSCLLCLFGWAVFL